MKQCAVVVPIYRLPLPPIEARCLILNTRKLRSWPLVFVLPKRLLSQWRAIEHEAVSSDAISFDDSCFAGIDEYNALLLSTRFYRRFKDFRYILICQTDAIIVRNELAYWCEQDYSYIGAPWFVGYDKPKVPYRYLGVGNGGFSLRRVAHFLRVLNVPRVMHSWHQGLADNGRVVWIVFRRILYGPKVQEDKFWGLVARSLAWFSVPDIAVAMRFSFEVAPRFLLEQNAGSMPFGGHAWEKYDKQFWLEQIEGLEQ
jgi:hypothetical protein